MIKVLFICHGNICRSTMAEMVFKHMVKQAHMDHLFLIDSMGTSSEELGNPVHPGTRRKLAQAGIPCSDHRATLMSKRDYDKYDYLIVMDQRNIRNLMYIIGSDPENKVSMLLDYAGREGQSIADPWYTGNFDETYEDVSKGCEGLLDYFRRNVL